MISLIQSILAFIALCILLNGFSCLSSRRLGDLQKGTHNIETNIYSIEQGKNKQRAIKPSKRDIKRNIVNQTVLFCKNRKTRSIVRTIAESDELEVVNYQFKLISKSENGVVYPKASFTIETEKGEILKRGVTNLDGSYSGEIGFLKGETLYFRLQGMGFSDNRMKLEDAILESRDPLEAWTTDLWN